jgi:hypothetical protein
MRSRESLDTDVEKCGGEILTWCKAHAQVEGRPDDGDHLLKQYPEIDEANFLNLVFAFFPRDFLFPH